MESIAHRVPTVTTNQAGFGRWVLDNFPENHSAVTVLNRPDDDINTLDAEISDIILKTISLSDDELTALRKKTLTKLQLKPTGKSLSITITSYTMLRLKRLMRE